jgi:Protein of unknown function (DUF2974)
MISYTLDDADSLISEHATHWLICLESYEVNRRPVVGRFWDLVHGDDETCIYRLRCNHKRLIVAFRGTENSKDLYDDWKITMNQVFPRAQQALASMRSLMRQKPGRVIQLTGHSLGGAIAREVGRQLQLPVVTFNAAAPPTAPVVSGNNEVNYHIVFDIISAWQSPFTVRIDKGFRPIPRWWERFTYATWLYANISDLAESHSLVNFSNARPGKVICGQEESEKMNSWLRSLPHKMRLLVYTFVFGVSGGFGLPTLEGCFRVQGKDFIEMPSGRVFL